MHTHHARIHAPSIGTEAPLLEVAVVALVEVQGFGELVHVENLSLKLSIVADGAGNGGTVSLGVTDEVAWDEVLGRGQRGVVDASCLPALLQMVPDLALQYL